MKVTLTSILAARDTLGCMKCSRPVPYRIVRDIHSLRDILNREAETAREAQEDLIESFGGMTNAQGAISFSTPENASGYETAWKEALNTEIDIPIQRIDLRTVADCIDFTRIDVDLEALALLVNLGEEDEKHG